MFITLEDVNQLKKALSVPELLIEVKKEWGNDVILHTEKMKARLKDTSNFFKGAGQTAISYAEGAGGFAILPDSQFHLGFDIELRSKVRPAMVNRIIKNQQELIKARLPENLLAAKKSASQAIELSAQLASVSDIEIDHWTMHDQDLETFFIKHPEQYGFSMARGVVLIKDDYCFGLFICKK